MRRTTFVYSGKKAVKNELEARFNRDACQKHNCHSNRHPCQLKIHWWSILTPISMEDHIGGLFSGR
jgi:hypothetical protein